MFNFLFILSFQISAEVKKKFAESLGQISYDLPLSVIESTIFYRVPFTEVLNLVASRRVFLSQVNVYKLEATKLENTINMGRK